jgi:hypothetical protein
MGRLSYDIQLHGFIDSDWAGSADNNNCMDLSILIGQGVQNNRRSASWICFSLSFATISWASRKQKFVALNTAEAEYISACDACTEAAWLRKLVSGLFD